MSLDKVVGWVKANRMQLALLLLIFALAFGIRAHLFKYEYMFGFDSYYHARMVETVLEQGDIPRNDQLAYYFIGGVPPPRNQFFWYFSAALYKVGSIPFTLGTYNKELWVEFVKFLPALFGALISVAMFFVGKEFYSKRVGYFMAFFAAIVPSFVYRTLAGFFEEDSLGFLWLVIGLVFFARALKNPVFNRKHFLNAVLAGAFFGVMALTWDLFLLIPIILVLYFVFALMNIYPNQGFSKTIDFAKLFGTSFLMMISIATASYGLSWIQSAQGYALGSVFKALAAVGASTEMAGVMMLGLFIAFAALMLFLAHKKENATIKLISTILLYVFVIAIVYMFLTTPVLFQEQTVLGQTVGEENTGKQFFGIKYNALIVFPWLALLLIPIRLFRDKRDHLSAMIFFWVLITLFMAWYKLKFTYTFGLPIAAAAGIIVAEAFYYVGNRTTFEKKTVALSLGFMLLIGIASASIFVPDKVPHIENRYPDWKGMLLWMQDPENIPVDAKMFNWWDNGHWISFIGERAVSADNRNASFEGNRDFALFVTASDVNQRLSIAKEYDFDYVILASDMFASMGSFAHYGYNTMDNMDPRVAQFYLTQHFAIPCSGSEQQGRIVYNCGGTNNIPAEQMNSIATKWNTNVYRVETLPNGLTVPTYLYRGEDNSEIYLVDPPVNQSTLARLWFKEPETMQYFEEVYALNGMRIFKVKKDALAAWQPA